jgi:hypothetical protein
MKKLILLASFLSIAGTTHAQRAMGASASAPNSSGGGGIPGGLSSPHNSASSTSAGPYSGPRANASGTNPGEFVPSTFESYKEAVIAGQEELNAKPLQVAEAARMAQALKKSGAVKPVLIAEQDDDGNVIISGPTAKRN